MRKVLLCLLLLGTAAAHAQPQPITDYIRAAIESGQASGSVTGPVLQESKAKLSATGPLYVTVTRLHRFQQEGCARLSLEFKQREAMPAGQQVPGDYHWDIQMNLCADGQAPTNTTRLDRP